MCLSMVVICFGLFSSFGGPAAAWATLLLGTAGYTVLGAAGVTAPFLASIAISVITYCSVGSFEYYRLARAGLTAG